jgi:PhnB protein
MQITPTIYFQGTCREALAFYRNALGAEVLFEHSVGSFAAPGSPAPGTEDKIIRAGMRLGESVVYLSDGHHAGPRAFQGFSLALKLDSRDEAERVLALLADGGRVLIALRQTRLAEVFGTVLDRFGVHWTIEA